MSTYPAEAPLVDKLFLIAKCRSQPPIAMIQPQPSATGSSRWARHASVATSFGFIVMTDPEGNELSLSPAVVGRDSRGF
jgi:hypothetical protein